MGLSIPMIELEEYVKIKSYKDIKELAQHCEIEKYTKNNIIYILIFMTAMVGVCITYKMTLLYITLVVLLGLFCVPVLLFHIYLQKKENIRFNDVDIYIHQMSYSFQRSPKIITALKDVSKIVSGKMKQVVDKAIYEIEIDKSSDIFQKALGIIEKEYDCQRIKTLHRFLISIEEKGGSYNHSLEILLMDFDKWVKRVYKYQEDIKHIKTNSIIGIFISCVLASISVMISSMLSGISEITMDISDNVIYQLVSMAFVMGCLVYYTYLQVRHCKNWLDSKRDENKIMKDYVFAFGKKPEAVKKFGWIVGTIIACISFGTAIWFNLFIGIVLLMVAIGIIVTPKLNKKSALLRLQEDIYIAFSEWLRDVVINLAEEPLHAAIVETYDTCPAVIKPSLGQFIYELEESPTDVRPYYNFLSEYEILDISSTVKMLYSISELDYESIDTTMNTLIKRNYEMIDKHEEVKNQNSISVMQFAEYIPMIFVSLKISADMLLVITNYL